MGCLEGTDYLTIRAGRFGLEIADGLVFSENNWENVPTAHEGLSALLEMEYFHLTLAALKTHEFGAQPGVTLALGNDPERDLYLLSADIKNLPAMMRFC